MRLSSSQLNGETTNPITASLREQKPKKNNLKIETQAT